MQMCALSGAPAAFAGNDLVTAVVRPNNDRLDHPACRDRDRQLLQRLLGKPPPRLAGMRPDLRHGYRLHACDARSARKGLFRRRLAQQGRKSAAQTARALAHDIVVHAVHFLQAACRASFGMRAISSRARAI